VGFGRIAKRTYRFLVFDSLVEDNFRFKQSFNIEGEFDHFPIVLEMEIVGKRLGNLFKFNIGWLEEANFVKMVKYLWIPYNDNLRESSLLQFSYNLKNIK